MMETKDSSQDIAIARIEITVDKICKSVDHLVTVIDGSNGDGLKTKVGKLITTTRIHWILLFFIIGGILYGKFG